MSHKITVLLNRQGETALLTNFCRAVTYTRRAGVWTDTAEKDFTLNGVTSMEELRARIADLAAFMADNRIFVAAKIHGIAASIMKQENIKIREIEGRPKAFLDTILEEAEEEFLRDNSTTLTITEDDTDISSIRETSSGHYAVSLIEIQENNTQVTTKHVLLPFLRKEKFHVLKITCSHVPQWLEPEIMAHRYSLNVTRQSESLVEVIVTSGIT